MRVLTLTNMYPPHHYGGYELSCRDVMGRWRERGHEVTVLTTDLRVDGVADDPGERAAGVRRDLRWYWDDHAIVSPPVRARLAVERHNQRVLAAALDEARPDVVSVWHMGAMSIGLLAAVVERGVPAVYAVCDDWMAYAPRVDAWARLFLRGRGRLLAPVVRRVAGVPTAPADLTAAPAAFCFVSDHVRRVTAEQGWWRPPGGVVVYSGIDRRDFPGPGPAAAVPAAPERPWRWRLLYVGRLDERKGVDVAVRALALLPPEATLDVVGRGDDAYRARLVALAAELGAVERVRFSVADRSELGDRYASADAVVFPVTWPEPFGLVPLEAMACATPVVATGTGGSGEFLVDGSNCLLHRPGDPASLAAALGRLATDGELRARLVAGGLATAAELTADRLADVLEEWHRAAADRFAHGRPPERRLAGR